MLTKNKPLWKLPTERGGTANEDAGRRQRRRVGKINTLTQYPEKEDGKKHAPPKNQEPYHHRFGRLLGNVPELSDRKFSSDSDTGMPQYIACLI
jgi:hypothetical protein